MPERLTLLLKAPTSCPWCHKHRDDWLIWQCHCGFRVFTCPSCGSTAQHNEVVALHQAVHKAQDEEWRKKRSVNRPWGRVPKPKKKWPWEEDKRKVRQVSVRQDDGRILQALLDERALQWLAPRKQAEALSGVIQSAGLAWEQQEDPLVAAWLVEPDEDEEAEPSWPDMPRYLDVVQATEMLYNGRRW